MKNGPRLILEEQHLKNRKQWMQIATRKFWIDMRRNQFPMEVLGH